MRKVEQALFVKELADNVVAEITANIEAGKVPEDWNGVELRQLMAHKFADAVLKDTITGKRLREFKHTCLVNNL